MLIGYRLFGRPGGPEPAIPGLTPRCDYGIEFLVVLAFLVYVIGLSLAKACSVLAFFCHLPLSRSQADALLRQLAKHWQVQFDTLCELIAHAAVVYVDETGWKVGTEGCSLWTFASACQRVFLFGCHKDAATLDTLLPPDVFRGIGVSDDAAGEVARPASRGRRETLIRNGEGGRGRKQRSPFISASVVRGCLRAGLIPSSGFAV